MEFLGRLGGFIHKQSRNYRVLLVHETVTSFLTQLVENFNSLYTVALGATPFQLSAVRSMGSAVNALISIPAGWLSDVYSLKKIMILGLMVQVFSAVFYAFAQSWIWIIVAVLFETLTMTLIISARTILVADSLVDHSRATGYGLRTTIVQICCVSAPTIGGILVSIFGGISVEGIRPLYFIQLIGFAAISIYVILKLRDIETGKAGRTRSFLRDFKEMFKTGKGLKRFAFLQTLDITAAMSTPFFYLYAVEFKGANSLIIGYMGTCFVLAYLVLAVPMGHLADRRGRKFIIFLSRPLYYGSYLLLVFTPRGAFWLLMLAWCMRGALTGVTSAWTTMSIEMVPKKYRGRWTGFISLFTNLIRIPAMLLGGYLYESVNPALVFLIPIVVDALVRMPILATIPETLGRRDWPTGSLST